MSTEVYCNRSKVEKKHFIGGISVVQFYGIHSEYILAGIPSLNALNSRLWFFITDLSSNQRRITSNLGHPSRKYDSWDKNR